MVPIQLADIVARLDHISEVWRSGTSDEQRTDLADLDTLLGRLETIDPETAVEAERIDELRGRIEILMDEIEISLGIEPPAFYSPRIWTPAQTSGPSSTTLTRHSAAVDVGVSPALGMRGSSRASLALGRRGITLHPCPRFAAGQ